MTSNPTRSALLLIDMENGFVDPRGGHCIRGAQATVPACAQALDTARAKGIPVFFVKRIYRCDGSDVELTRYAGWKAGGRPAPPPPQGPTAPRRRSPCAPGPGTTPSGSPAGAPFSRRSWI